ncbi:MAG TPA: S8 family serine peptidase [Ignavibacteriales bacterium]|nr:S8 family serine peptidase [Ignavibacteriales bacterium]
MKKILILLISFIFCYANSKIDLKLKNLMLNDSTSNIFVWIIFKDKGSDTLYYKQNPHLYLSQRAIERRRKFFGDDQLVNFYDYPVSNNYINQIKNLGIKIRNKSRWLNAVSAFLTPAQISSVSNLSFVKKIDALQQYQSPKKPVKENLPEVLHKVNNDKYDYGLSLDQNEIIKVPYAHNIGLSGNGILIGMFDAGFTNLGHEIFSNMKIHATWDFVNNDADVEDGNDMGSGSHGTATLSCIGGFKSGKLIGPAFNATYVLAKTENTESETPLEEDNWIAAIEWADSIGIDIASTSLGYIDYDVPYISYVWQYMDGKTSKITQAADIAVTRGIVVLNSAGNEGDNDEHNTLGMPADGFNVIAVGAVNKYGSRASFSSVGPSADGRIKPDIMAMGQNVTVASSYGNNYYGSSGTSFSCPLAAGATALLLEANPYLSPFQMRELLRSTASKSDNPDNKFGWGIINVQKALEKLKANIMHSVDNYNVDDDLLNIFATFETFDSKLTAYLMYKTNDSNIFDSVKFTKYYGSVYVAKLKIDSNWNKLKYYIKAKNNSIFTSYYPLNAPDSILTLNLKPDSIEKYFKNKDFVLYQNYPNPFNPTTTLKFNIIKADFYQMKIYDSHGKLLLQVFDDYFVPGLYEKILKLNNFASSNYFVELINSKSKQIIKISLIK